MKCDFSLTRNSSRVVPLPYQRPDSRQQRCSLRLGSLLKASTEAFLRVPQEMSDILTSYVKTSADPKLKQKAHSYITSHVPRAL